MGPYGVLRRGLAAGDPRVSPASPAVSGGSGSPIGLPSPKRPPQGIRGHMNLRPHAKTAPARTLRAMIFFPSDAPSPPALCHTSHIASAEQPPNSHGLGMTERVAGAGTGVDPTPAEAAVVTGEISPPEIPHRLRTDGVCSFLSKT